MVSRINLQGFCHWFYRLVFKGFFGMSQELTRVCNGFLEYLSRFIQGFFFSLVILNVISKGFTAYFKGVFQSSLFQESHLLYSRVSVIIQGVTSIVG